MAANASADAQDYIRQLAGHMPIMYTLLQKLLSYALIQLQPTKQSTSR